MVPALAPLHPADLPADCKHQVGHDAADPDPAEAQWAASEQADHLREWRHAVRVYALARRPDAPFVSRRTQRWAWVLALALHLIFIMLGRLALRQVPPAPEPSVIQVQLIEAPAEQPDLPLPAPALQRPPRQNVMHSAPRTPMAPPPVPSLPAMPDVREPEVRAYNPDSSVNLPDDFADQLDKARPKSDFIPLRVVPSPLFAAKRPLKVRPNHFAQYWNGTDGMPLHESMWRYVTATKEFTAPWGGHYGCTWVLILVACADIPDKPWNPPQTWKPATEFDER